jgi:hypothetical protein
MSLAFLSAVQACALDRWSPHIGDPNGLGWATVIVYLVAALVALAVALRAPFPAPTRPRERFFWLMLAVILLGLAVNKQLDLQSYLTAVGRCIAKEQGWYQERRLVQFGAILLLLGTMTAVALGMWRMMRGTLARSGVALAGLVMVLGFVAIRAVGFHHVDQLINLDLAHMRLNWLFELTGPVLIILSGVALLLRPDREAAPKGQRG